MLRAILQPVCLGSAASEDAVMLKSACDMGIARPPVTRRHLQSLHVAPRTPHINHLPRRALDINPRDYRAWYGLGQTYEILQARASTAAAPACSCHLLPLPLNRTLRTCAANPTPCRIPHLQHA